MSRLILAAFVVLVPCLPCQPPGGAETRAKPVFRIHDLGGTSWMDMTAVRGFVDLPLHSTVIGGAGESKGRQAWGETVTNGTPLTESKLERILCEMVGPDAFQEIEWRQARDQLWATAPPALHDQIAAGLATIRGAMTQRVDVRIHVLTRAALRDAPGPVLSPKDVAALIAKHPPTSTTSTSMWTGRLTRMMAGRRKSVVADLDVEVAQDAFTGDPLVNQMQLGLELNAAAHIMSDRRLLLVAGGRRLDLLDEKMRVFEVGQGRVMTMTSGEVSVDVGNIQLPRGQATVNVCSAAIEDGGGLLMGHDASAGGLWLMTARRTGPPAPAPKSGALLIPAGELIAMGVRRGLGATPPNPSGFGAGVGGFDEPDDSEGPVPIADLETMLTWAVGDLGDEDRAPWIRPLADHVIVGPIEHARKLEAMLPAFSRTFARTAGIEVRFGYVGNDVSPDDLRPTALASSLRHAALIAARRGDEFSVITGVEEAILKDYDVEIAQAASGPDPITDGLFTGFSFDGTLEAADDRRVVVDARVFAQEHLRPLKGFDLDSNLGAVDQVDVASNVQHGRWTLPVGQWTVLHRSRVEGTERNLVVVVRANVH